MSLKVPQCTAAVLHAEQACMDIFQYILLQYTRDSKRSRVSTGLNVVPVKPDGIAFGFKIFDRFFGFKTDGVTEIDISFRH
ncbi:TPA: hypothetical protein ACGFAU_001988 [Yersinia enterocolitica]